jgi:hypothetical protein
MSRLREEMRVIPRAAWGIALVVYLVLMAGSWFIFFPRDVKFQQWPTPAWHALRHVDAAGLFHPQRDRNHSVLHPARASAARLSRLRNDGEPRIRILSEVRRVPGAGVSRMPLGSATGVVPLH